MFRTFYSKCIIVLTVCIFLFGAAVAVHADVNWNATFTGTGYDFYQTGLYDGSGWINVTAHNLSEQAWGDFHFFVYDIGEGLPDVRFVGDPDDPDVPTGSQSPMTWNLRNDGQAIDLFYYSDPVLAGETGAQFSVHIENPHKVLHGVAYYPTVVPEPVSSALFLAGGATLGFRRFFKKGRATKKRT